MALGRYWMKSAHEGARNANQLQIRLAGREMDLGEAAVSMPAASFEGAILQSMLAGYMVDIALASESSPRTDEQLDLARSALYSMRGFLERFFRTQGRRAFWRPLCE
jgi:hypothetical protein